MKIMKFEDAQKEIIINCGGLGYDAEKMAHLLDMPLEEIDCLMKDADSDLCKLYNMGAFRAEYRIDSKLLNLALQGDLKALEKLEARKMARKRLLKKEINENEKSEIKTHEYGGKVWDANQNKAIPVPMVNGVIDGR